MRIPSNGGYGVSTDHLLSPGKASSSRTGSHSLELFVKGIQWKHPTLCYISPICANQALKYTSQSLTSHHPVWQNWHHLFVFAAVLTVLSDFTKGLLKTTQLDLQ